MVALFVAGCSQPPIQHQSSNESETKDSVQSEPVTQLNLTTAGITVHAPDGWAFSSEPPEEADGLLQPVSSGQDLPAIILQARKVEPDITLEVAVSSFARFLGPDMEAKEIIVDEAFHLPVHDIPAYEIRYHGRVQDELVTCSHIIFLHDGSVVVITQMTKKEEFDELLPVVTSLLDKLAFN